MSIRKIWQVITSAAILSAPGMALAQGLSGIQPFEGTAQSNLPTAITNIVNVLLILAALVAGIYLIVGGVKYITAGGDEGQMDKAKNQILYAVIGLIVIGLAAAIVNFIVGAIGSA